MKQQFFTGILASLFISFGAAAQPQARWLSTDHDFGAFGEDMGRATTTFYLVNTGNEPLVITTARANCGCTTPRYTTEPIAPGDTTTLEVSYNPAGRPGRFTKNVYVDTNAEPSRTTLTIHGVVIGSPSTVSQRYPFEAGPLSLQNSTVLLGRIERGRIKNLFVSAYNTSTDSVRPTFANVPRWLEVSATPATVPPGQQTSFSFFVHSDRTPAYGLITDTLTLHVAGHETKIPVIANIVEHFDSLADKQLSKAPQVRLSTERLEFGERTAADPGAPLTFTIKNDGKSPLVIHRVYTADRGFRIDAPAAETRLKPGKEATITVSIDPTVTANTLSARIIVITNDPLSPETPVRATAALH